MMRVCVCVHLMYVCLWYVCVRVCRVCVMNMQLLCDMCVCVSLCVCVCIVFGVYDE